MKVQPWFFEKTNKIDNFFQANLLKKKKKAKTYNIRYKKRGISQVQERLKNYNNNVCKPMKINVKT